MKKGVDQRGVDEGRKETEQWREEFPESRSSQ